MSKNQELPDTQPASVSGAQTASAPDNQTAGTPGAQTAGTPGAQTAGTPGAAGSAETAVNEIHEQMQIRMDKLHELVVRGSDPFEQVQYPVTCHSQDILDQFVEMEGQAVSLAGRLMSKRGMGKVSFSEIGRASCRERV